MPKKRSLHQQLVHCFMGEMGQVLPEIPVIPDVKVRELWARLILEEALETVRALGFAGRAKIFETKMIIELEAMLEPDLVEIADGCLDVRFVATGTLSACGIADEKGQLLVDENNLAKFKDICPECNHDQTGEHPGTVIMRTGEEFGTEPGSTVCFKCGFQYRSGYRRDDGKWVKPADHKPPDIRGLLIEQGWKDG